LFFSRCGDKGAAGAFAEGHGLLACRPAGLFSTEGWWNILPESKLSLEAESNDSDPVPVDCAVPPSARFLQPQTETTGMKAVFGKWPGDETDEEVLRTLAEIE
jgi:hypothetical protein